MSDPASALIGAGSSLIGGVMNMFSTNSNNKFQAREKEKERQWQTKMRDEERSYNDPAAVKQRQRDAGINPNVPNSSAPQGLSSGAPSSTGTPQTQAAQPGEFIAAAGTDLSSMLETKRVNDSVIAKNDAETARTLNDIKNNSVGGINYDILNSNLAQNKSTLEATELQNQLLDNELALKNMFGTQERSLQLQNLTESILNQKSTRKLNDAQLLNYLQSRLESRARTEGIDIQNSLNKQSIPLLLNSYKLKNESQALLNYSQQGTNLLNDKYAESDRHNALRSSILDNGIKSFDFRTKQKDFDYYDVDRYRGYVSDVIHGAPSKLKDARPTTPKTNVKKFR